MCCYQLSGPRLQWFPEEKISIFFFCFQNCHCRKTGQCPLRVIILELKSIASYTSSMKICPLTGDDMSSFAHLWLPFWTYDPDFVLFYQPMNVTYKTWNLLVKWYKRRGWATDGRRGWYNIICHYEAVC